MLSKTFQKRNFRQNPFDLGHLELLEVAKAWSNLHDKHSIVFYEKCLVKISGA